MIAVQTKEGELVKVLKNMSSGDLGFHKVFGLISKEQAEVRKNLRKRQAHDFTSDEWLCSFKLDQKSDGLRLLDPVNCDLKSSKEGWTLLTPMGDFLLSDSSAVIADSSEKTRVESFLESKILPLGLLLFLLTFIVMNLMTPEEVIEEEKEKVPEPITVQIIKKVKTVNIARESNPNIKVKPLTKKEKSHRAVKRNLGFLGMIGSKDLKKAVGGVPQKLEKATAGAGPGGDAGSGGEVLTGLGKGLKKITVGNTGVAGLGGIGTKGAGGGKGGYGNTMVASGEGTGISAISVSKSDLVLQGGLSRYAINATIAKYLNQVRRCYEAQLKLIPELQGLVEMGFEINGRGRLNFSKVRKTTLKNKKTEDCIAKKMMGWQFPKPKGGVNVAINYPFMLRPMGQ